MYDQIRSLYDSQLWSNLSSFGAVFLQCPLVSQPGPSSMADGQTGQNWVSLYAMVAEGFYEMGQMRKAEGLYKEVLNSKLRCDILSDTDLKWRLFRCHQSAGQKQAALSALQSISPRQRPAKVHLALARMYEGGGVKRSAIACYKEVLKLCPLAMEVVMKLMQLGVKAREVQELTLEAAGDCDWLNTYIQAYSAFASKDYATSAQSFLSLEANQPQLRNDVPVLVLLGKSQYYQGDYAKAMETLTRAHKLDPTHTQGMDVLAALLMRERRHSELEALATKLITVSESVPESWIAMGYYCFLNKKGSRAVYFGHKACMVDHKSVEALLLKGNVLLDLKKVTDALNHFREAVNVAPSRFELNQGLVDCYLALERPREAVSVAASAVKSTTNTGGHRELTLFASVLAKGDAHTQQQPSLGKAKNLLEKALKSQPDYLPAVYLLAEILEQELNLDGAISLLQNKLRDHSTAKLHLMLADLLAKTHEEEKAMEHYAQAVNLDPKNEGAHKGLAKIEQSTDAPLEVTYDLGMEEDEEQNPSETGDPELDESETEAVWSDGDLNLAASNTSSRYL